MSFYYIMDLGTISVRYAKAFLSFAIDNGEEDKVYQEMDVLKKSFFEVPLLKDYLLNPILATEDKIKLLVTACGSDVSKTTAQFFKFVVERNKQSYMHFICMSYQSLYRKSKNIISAELITAREVDKEVLEKLMLIIQHNHQETLMLKVQVNSELIGGFVLNIENSQLDASVKGQLRDIKNSFLAK